jgi:hypothetical protein
VLAAGEFVVAPGVFEMFSAKIADRLGFKALYMTGYGFRRLRRLAGFGVWTIPSPCPGGCRGLGAARLVSTPSRPTLFGRAWLGIAISQVPPTLSSSASPVFRRALKFVLSPVRLPIPPRPHGFKLARIND